jgi:fructose-1,6-bisphosphatase I
MLMNAVQHACKVCANAIKKAGPCDLYGLAGEQNSTGDDVKKLDIIANTVWVDCLKNSGVCCLLVSEEEEQPIIIEDKEKSKPHGMVYFGDL